MRQDWQAICAGEVRRLDPDRYATTLFAPESVRARLQALYAFNLEIARTRETVSEPALGEIRLQWWSEAVEEAAAGRPREHPVVQALAALAGDGGLDSGAMQQMIEARRSDLYDDSLQSVADLLAYGEATSSTLVRLALSACGAVDAGLEAAARNAGIAVALAGLLRALPYQARQQRCQMPVDLMTRHGVSRQRLKAAGQTGRLAPLVREIADLARNHLDRARAEHRRVPAAAIPALLPASVAGAYLGALARAGGDVFAAEPAAWPLRRPLLLAWQAWRGRY